MAVISGWLLIVLGFLLFLPSFGASFILSVFGVFLVVPKHRCKDCGWKKRAR